MYNNNEFLAMHLLNIIVAICLFYLAFNNTVLCLALLPFQAFAAFWMWRGIRDEVSNGNKQ